MNLKRVTAFLLLGSVGLYALVPNTVHADTLTTENTQQIVDSLGNYEETTSGEISRIKEALDNITVVDEEDVETSNDNIVEDSGNVIEDSTEAENEANVITDSEENAVEEAENVSVDEKDAVEDIEEDTSAEEKVIESAEEISESEAIKDSTEEDPTEEDITVDDSKVDEPIIEDDTESAKEEDIIAEEIVNELEGEKNNVIEDNSEEKHIEDPSIIDYSEKVVEPGEVREDEEKNAIIDDYSENEEDSTDVQEEPAPGIGVDTEDDDISSVEAIKNQAEERAVTGNKTDCMVGYVKDISDSNLVGYSQATRNSDLGNIDCSSLMIEAADLAGYSVSGNGATYTGNMKDAFEESGFRDVLATGEADQYDVSTLHAGDVLLKEGAHTVMYVGDGKVAGARISENDDIYGEAGDQTGEEVCVHDYYIYDGGWDCILREPDDVSASEDQEQKWYRVRTTWGDESSQSGAFLSIENAIAQAMANGQNVYDAEGNLVYDSHYTAESNAAWRETEAA